MSLFPLPRPPRPPLFPYTTLFRSRAYQLLTEEVGFPPEDIVFDPNIFAVATGIDEHRNYGVDFIQATRRITETLPDVDRKSTRLNSSHSQISYAVFCLKKKKNKKP